jgi:hypothetical protein
MRIEKSLGELLAEFASEPPAFTRRAALGGMSALVAAPFVIRTAGILMPVTRLSRSELEWQTILGTRNWQKHPPTVTEVKAWLRSIRYSWNTSGLSSRDMRGWG